MGLDSLDSFLKIALSRRFFLSGCRLFLALTLFFGPASSFSAENPFEFFEEEARFGNPGVLTRTERQRIPASVTRISAEDIALTPARNIYDLLEVYVPGSFWMNHNEAPHPGIRGIISDRNTKILLLINGVNINQTAHQGATDELENWDLNDIHEIQVIRGPGSVTYGPGAIAGVINVITKDAVQAQGFQAGAKGVATYRSYGGYAGYGHVRDNLKIYSYASVTGTRGNEFKTFDVATNGQHGVYGQDNTNTGAPPSELFRDYNDDPQIKLHTQVDLNKDWTLMARFVQAGAVVDPTLPKGQTVPGGTYNLQKVNRTKYILLTLKNEHEFSDRFRLKSTIGAHTYDRIRITVPPATGVTNPESILHKPLDYGSERGFAQVLANMMLSEKHEVAVGAEYSHEHIGAGWGRKSWVIRGSSPAIGGGPDINSRGEAASIINEGNGWSTDTTSALSEMNLKFDPRFNLMLSGRADKTTFSKTVYSPRIAASSDLGRAGFYRLILQESNRISSSAELLREHKNGQSSDPERLRGAELIWDSNRKSPLSLTSSIFHNRLSVLSYNAAAGKTTKTGDLELVGVEVEAKHVAPRLTVGANHSFVKQLNWHLAPGVVGSGISYSDVARTVSGTTQRDTGNDLNNWSNHATKIFANAHFLNKRLTIHTDARVFWDFEGAKDGLKMLENAAQGTAQQTAVNNSIQALRDRDAYDIQFRLNMSALYRFTPVWSATLFVINLLGKNNHRYSYDAGVTTATPTRSEITWEPRTVGLRVDCRFGPDSETKPELLP